MFVYVHPIFHLYFMLSQYYCDCICMYVHFFRYIMSVRSFFRLGLLFGYDFCISRLPIASPFVSLAEKNPGMLYCIPGTNFWEFYRWILIPLTQATHNVSNELFVDCIVRPLHYAYCVIYCSLYVILCVLEQIFLRRPKLKI